MGGALGNFGKTISSNMAGKTGLFSPTGAIGGSGLGQFLHKINTNMSGETGLFAKDGALGGGDGILGFLKNLGSENTYGDPQGSATPPLQGRAADAGYGSSPLTASLMQYMAQRPQPSNLTPQSLDMSQMGPWGAGTSNPITTPATATAPIPTPRPAFRPSTRRRNRGEY